VAVPENAVLLYSPPLAHPLRPILLPGTTTQPLFPGPRLCCVARNHDRGHSPPTPSPPSSHSRNKLYCLLAGWSAVVAELVVTVVVTLTDFLPA